MLPNLNNNYVNNNGEKEYDTIYPKLILLKKNKNTTEITDEYYYDGIIIITANSNPLETINLLCIDRTQTSVRLMLK